MFATFNRFELEMTMRQAQGASHPGPCDADVEELCRAPGIRRQLDKIPADKIREELREYGAWDDSELADNEANRRRIVWIAAGDIVEAN